MRKQCRWNLFYFTRIVLLAGVLAVSVANAAEDWKITIGIGYADIHDSPILDSTRPDYKFSPALGRATFDVLRITALSFGMQESAPAGVLTTFRGNGILLQIVQPNISCPGEATSGVIRRNYGQECSAQKEASERAMEVFAAESAKSQAVLFIGHARGGDGFGFGNVRHFRARLNFAEFLRGFTAPGQLKLLFLGMCQSSSYYLPELRENSLFNVTRTITFSNDPDWWREVMPLAGRYVNLLLSDHRRMNELPFDIRVPLR